MHRVERSLLVPYSAAQMYALVADIASYPRFLPWCSGTDVRTQADDSVVARVDIDFRGLRTHFTTHNRQQAPQRIDMRLVDGPFRHLGGEWQFKPLGEDACKVHLELQFQFAAGLMGRLLAPVFEGIATSMVDAFSRRAESVYGPR